MNNSTDDKTYKLNATLHKVNLNVKTRFEQKVPASNEINFEYFRLKFQLVFTRIQFLDLIFCSCHIFPTSCLPFYRLPLHRHLIMWWVQYSVKKNLHYNETTMLPKRIASENLFYEKLMKLSCHATCRGINCSPGKSYKHLLLMVYTFVAKFVSIEQLTLEQQHE